MVNDNMHIGLVSCNQENERGRKCIIEGDFPAFKNMTGFLRSLPGGRKAIRTSDDGSVSYPDWVSGSVMMLRRDVLNDAGGMDEDYWMYYEDVDLCKRVRNLNLEVACLRNVVIEHNHGGSSRINPATAALTKTEVMISGHIYMSKHKRGAGRLAIQMALAVINLVSCGLSAVAGIVFFFIPKLWVRSLIFGKLVSYYYSCIFRRSWLSKRSVNYNIK